MMKKVILNLLFVSCLGAGVMAQNMNIETAGIALSNNELETAKHYIDLASEYESTKNDRRMWFNRGKIYLSIATSDKEEIRKLDPMAGYKSLESYLNCIRVDRAEKKRRYPEAEEEYLGAIAPCYNLGFEFFKKGSDLMETSPEEGKAALNEAIKCWSLILDSYEFDKNKQISTVFNLPEANVLQYMADAAIKAKDNAKAIELFERVMKGEKPISYAFTRSALLHMEMSDTVKALDVISAGRAKFPEDKDLTNLELMVYQNQGKVDVLINKITEALNNNPDDPILYFNRANLYDNRSRPLTDKFKDALQVSYKSKEKMKRATAPKDKAKFKAQADSADQVMAAVMAEQNHLDSLAIADYRKAAELNPDYFDAMFNLGAIYFNKALPLVEKANSLPVDGNYEKDYEILKKQWVSLYEEALVWFLKAEVLKGDDDIVLMSLQQTYAQLGNEAKSMEYKNKRD